MVLIALLTWTASANPVSGRFEPAESPARVEEIPAAAVEEAAGQVAWIVRGIARSRLGAVATACPGYRFDVAGDRFEVQCDGKDPFTWTVGKTGPWTSPDGNPVHMSLERRGTGYVLDFASEDGGKTFTYDFDADGGLRVTQQVRSGHLTTPMRWTLSYRRR